jgi:hypothetical protein
MSVKRGGLCPGGKPGAGSVNERRSKEVEVSIMGLERFNKDKVPNVSLDGRARRDRIRELSDQ